MYFASKISKISLWILILQGIKVDGNFIKSDIWCFSYVITMGTHALSKALRPRSLTWVGTGSPNSAFKVFKIGYLDLITLSGCATAGRVVSRSSASARDF